MALKKEPGAAPAEKKAADDVGEINMRAAARKVWLVKVPDFLAREWENAPPDQELGKLRIPTGQSPKIRLDISGAQSAASIPVKNFLLELNGKDQPLPAMEILAEGEGHEGVVDRRGDLAAEGFTSDVRRHIKEMNEKANTKKRGIRVVTDAKDVMVRTGASRVTSTVPTGPSATFQKRRRAPSPSEITDKKRVRRERAEVEDQLFKLFEIRQYYTLTELKDATQQPVQFLRDILQDLGVYNKRGPNKAMWELKPEYRTQNSKTDQAPPAAAAASNEEFEDF